MPSLTGLPLQIIAAVLAVAVFAATMWLWPKLAGRGWKAWVGRIGAFLVTQVAVLVAMGLVANSYFGFYTTWSDLLGLDGKPGVVVDHQPGQAISVTGEQKMYSDKGSAKDRSGVIQAVSIKGASSGLSSTAYVYLPPQYFQPGFAQQQFPMALVLAGYPGSAEKLISLMAYPASTLKAINAGQLPPTVLVMMRSTVEGDGNRDTECMDVPNGPQVETFFTQDLPKAMSGEYRINDTPQARAVIGNSTGGYCALKFALRKPGAYSAAVSLSGYYTAPIDPTTGDLFSGSAQLKQQNDLLWRLQNTPAAPVSLLLASSPNEDDYPATQKMVAAFKAPTKLSTITLDSGGHNFHTWTREIPPALAWLGQRLTPPQQVHTA
ncbi:alpha/beta hydrolase-fold protein [Kitasatospora sp. MAP5-34]|uniref:alpha/beta hydrolase n=1 Tax=Kitasatospora sp. MAP5-34 TaxID=3035102 RepID=UPI002473FEA9|nr:alpha/beta hydrolase-fold protein [Kitasatospora sp. MAP5-34]MDH6579244.1 S-formylglutathione hydrolase FrmB [Kitasatospora sp. MAP5-34]